VTDHVAEGLAREEQKAQRSARDQAMENERGRGPQYTKVDVEPEGTGDDWTAESRGGIAPMCSVEAVEVPGRSGEKSGVTLA